MTRTVQANALPAAGRAGVKAHREAAHSCLCSGRAKDRKTGRFRIAELIVSCSDI